MPGRSVHFATLGMKSAVAILFSLAALIGGGRAEPSPAEAAGAEALPSTPEQALCALIEPAARNNGLPLAFFARLLWQESRFRSDAVSPKGAQGIAQFMPGTAAERGLEDPFDPVMAVPASAAFLAELRQQFGNLGLAAAGYNAGPQRVADWLGGDATLPLETRDFVFTITGTAADLWASDGIDADVFAADADKDCLTLLATLKVPRQDYAIGVETAHGPWGVQVAGNVSRARALSAYAALQRLHSDLFADRPPMIIRGSNWGARSFYRIRVPMQTRSAAEEWCQAFKRAGGSCIVLKT